MECESDVMDSLRQTRMLQVRLDLVTWNKRLKRMAVIMQYNGSIKCILLSLSIKVSFDEFILN